MRLKPLGTRLVIEKVEAEETTASGIVLPSSAQEAPSLPKYWPWEKKCKMTKNQRRH